MTEKKNSSRPQLIWKHLCEIQPQFQSEVVWNPWGTQYLELLKCPVESLPDFLDEADFFQTCWKKQTFSPLSWVFHTNGHGRKAWKWICQLITKCTNIRLMPVTSVRKGRPCFNLAAAIFPSWNARFSWLWRGRRIGKVEMVLRWA